MTGSTSGRPVWRLGRRPSLLTHDGVARSDVVITVGCGEACLAVADAASRSGPAQ